MSIIASFNGVQVEYQPRPMNPAYIHHYPLLRPYFFLRDKDCGTVLEVSLSLFTILDFYRF
jgi:hypothetical protein